MVGRLVDVDDLADAHAVAELLSLSHANSVHTYLNRYESFPRPVFDRGKRRARLWVLTDVEEWVREHRE